MAKRILHYCVLFVVLVFVQVLVCNNICIFNVATPFIFVYFLIRLPIDMRINWVLTLSFLTGLIVDVFSDTQGMNALACTLLGAVRNTVFGLYVTRKDEIADTIPSIKSLGISVYMKYLLTMTLLYCVIIVSIEAFTFHNALMSVLRALSSTILSFVVMLGIVVIIVCIGIKQCLEIVSEFSRDTVIFQKTAIT